MNKVGSTNNKCTHAQQTTCSLSNQQTWFSFNPKQRMEGFFLKGCNKKGDMDALPAIKD
jgi:hypothetical protein